MKSTGVVRRVDELGRLVVPKELRKTMGITEGSVVGFYTEGEQIILKKYEPNCIFCGEADEIIVYKGKNICRKCLEEIRKGI